MTTFPQLLELAYSGRLNGDAPQHLLRTAHREPVRAPAGRHRDRCRQRRPAADAAGACAANIDVTVIAAPALLEDPNTTIYAWTTRSVLWVMETGEITVEQARDARVALGARGRDAVRRRDDRPGELTPARGATMAGPKAALQQAVKASAAALDVVRRPAPGVVVLIYHRVGGGPGSRSTFPSRASTSRWRGSPRAAVSSTLADCARRARVHADAAHARPRRWSSSRSTTARPTSPSTRCRCSSDYRIPATLYAATAFIDEGIAFPGRRAAAVVGCAPRRGARPDWSTSARTRTAIGCSTGCRAAEVDDELDRSIALIGEHSGGRRVDFAYPKALLGSPAAERAVRARFRSAAIAGTRPNPYGAHRSVPAVRARRCR